MQAQPVVWIVSREHWPRACLRAELIERGFDAVGYPEISHALAAVPLSGERKPRMMVLDLCGQSLDGAVLSRLKQVRVPVILLGGAVELNDPITREFEWAAVLRRPFTLGKVADMVEKLAA
ncbi:MAG TPA: hypothetical protein VGK99_16095 [Acidobacteriota bacterium]|jgi:DNA-binding response OmpR family regulator